MNTIHCGEPCGLHRSDARRCCPGKNNYNKKLPNAVTLWFNWIGHVDTTTYPYMSSSLQLEGEQLLLTALGQAPLRTNLYKAAQERKETTQMVRSCTIENKNNGIYKCRALPSAAAAIADPLIWILSHGLPGLVHRCTGRRCSPEECMCPIKSSTGVDEPGILTNTYTQTSTCRSTFVVWLIARKGTTSYPRGCADLTNMKQSSGG